MDEAAQGSPSSIQSVRSPVTVIDAPGPPQVLPAQIAHFAPNRDLVSHRSQESTGDTSWGCQLQLSLGHKTHWVTLTTGICLLVGLETWAAVGSLLGGQTSATSMERHTTASKVFPLFLFV